MNQLLQMIYKATVPIRNTKFQSLAWPLSNMSRVTRGQTQHRWRSYGARRVRIGYIIGNNMSASRKSSAILKLLIEAPRTIMVMLWTTVSMISVRLVSISREDVATPIQ